MNYLSEVPKPERIPPVTCNMIGYSGNRKKLFKRKMTSTMSLDVLHCHGTREVAFIDVTSQIFELSSLWRNTLFWNLLDQTKFPSNDAH